MLISDAIIIFINPINNFQRSQKNLPDCSSSIQEYSNNNIISYVVYPCIRDEFHQPGRNLFERMKTALYSQNPYMPDRLRCCIRQSE
jgi:hypothetical protein